MDCSCYRRAMTWHFLLDRDNVLSIAHTCCTEETALCLVQPSCCPDHALFGG
ncbi:rCG49688 [Rattus norvegicus]|uniref:RCG49688 n=1 Tax=Rattus norvegicus TaxID=10116 RepID=A6K2P1_RAT|nr:rCG49688 [Rattus norvegicus]